MLKELYCDVKDIQKDKSEFFPGCTYGQLKPDGTTTIIEIFNERFNNAKGVFYDLGCGPGHMVMHVALDTAIGKSIGVELHKYRFKLANEIKENLIKKYPKKTDDFNKVSFINTDFFNLDIEDATIVYFDNTVLTKKLSDKVYASCPKGCLIITSRQLSKAGKYPPKTKAINRNYSSNGMWFCIKE